MFVLTIDQRKSRSGRDLVPDAIAALARIGGTELAASPARTAGDEVQTATTDAARALELALALTRNDDWCVGIGVGQVETPLPSDVRAGRGPAFIRARDAVERAKRAPTRFALGAAEQRDGADAEALVRLLLDLRIRRSPEGWEVYDLLAQGLTQKQIAERLGIGEPAVSLRARAAGLRLEESATPALARALAGLDMPEAAIPERPAPVED